MLKIIYVILTQKNGLGLPFGRSRSSSRWFELKVKLGCVWDVLQDRFLTRNKQGSGPELQDGVTARYTPEFFGKLRS